MELFESTDPRKELHALVVVDKLKEGYDFHLVSCVAFLDPMGPAGLGNFTQVCAMPCADCLTKAFFSRPVKSTDYNLRMQFCTCGTYIICILYECMLCVVCTRPAICVVLVSSSFALSPQTFQQRA